MIAVASVMSPTSTGTEESVSVPSPSWPDPLSPQHVMVPFWRSAQEWLLPAVSAVALFARSVVVDIGGVVVDDEAGRDVVVEDVLSDTLLQLAASSARGMNRLRAG